MCGFIAYKKQGNNFYIQKRGQDKTTEIKYKGFTFKHNLLSITGEFTVQPFIEDDIIVLYNGEIYNQPYKKSDGEVIIPLYKKYGWEFPKYLDGEWAIALYDFKKEQAIFATDLFATKPLWRNGLECASYKSGVGGEKIPANTIEVVGMNTGLTQRHIIYDFDFRQHKNTYDDWIEAFEGAVMRRAKDNCFIGLSSGYDSGAIDCVLKKYKVKFKSYTIKGEENQDILKARKAKPLNFTKYDYGLTRGYIKEFTEDFRYWNKQYMTDDKGAIGLAHICKLANKEGRRVYLSGQGADEIMSDYSKFPGQGKFQKFPKNLTYWDNFFGKCQESYIAKEEHIAGTFNIETRYPYLDKQVVQEFLWLNRDLKNRLYKAPLDFYMSKEGYPFDRDVKVGFRADKNL